MVKFNVLNSSRLDVAVAKELQISRNQALNLIKDSLVSVNLKLVSKPSFLLSENDKICVNFAPKKEVQNEYEVNFDIPIIYEDDDLIVLNKPPQIVVHQAPSVKEATLVEWLNKKGFMLSNLNGDVRAGIVHRLDKGTSGAIVVAKNNFAHAKLSEQLSDKSMGRIYLALTDLPLKEDVIIDKPIGRNPNNRLKKAIVEDAKFAKSAFVNLLSEGGVNLIAAKLFTGRTHQIRVHLASLNLPIVGDEKYGKNRANRMFLHAYSIALLNYKFKAPIPKEFNSLGFELSNKFEI